MNNIDLENIFKFKPFDQISKDSKNFLKQNLKIVNFNPGEILINQEISNDSIYILKS